MCSLKSPVEIPVVEEFIYVFKLITINNYFCLLYNFDSDDGKTIILEYKMGDIACSHDKRRGDNPHAKTVIKFTCGSTVGGPVYIER